MSLNNKTFSDNLIRIRKLKGISLIDLSKKTGISQRMITYYEKYATYTPLDKIELIAKALNVNVSDLLGTNKDSNQSDMTDFDVRTIKRLRKMLVLSKLDRSAVYKFIDSLANKEEYKDKLKKLQDKGLI